MNDASRITYANQTKAKNDSWIVVTTKIERSDGSVSQTACIQPRLR